MTRKVIRFEVPVDDKPHTRRWSGRSPHDVKAFMVNAREPGLVEFWVESDDSGSPDVTPYINADFIVVGTGHPIPDGAIWQGSCIWDGHIHRLVWHLYLLPADPP